MSIFQAKEGVQKLAKDLTLNTVMKTTSKYLSEGPIPVGEYKQASRVQPQQRYGSNRRMNKIQAKSNLNTSGVSSNAHMTDAASQNTQQNRSQISEPVFRPQSKQQNATVVNQGKIEIQQSKITKNQGSGTSIKNVRQNTQTPTPNRANSVFNSQFDQMFTDQKTPQRGRYGANRRIQTKQTEQIIQKYESQIPEIKDTPNRRGKLDDKAPSQISNSSSRIQQQIKSNVPSQTSRYGAASRTQVKKFEDLSQNSEIDRYSHTQSQVSTPKSGIDNPKVIGRSKISTQKLSEESSVTPQAQKSIEKNNLRVRTQISKEQKPNNTNIDNITKAKKCNIILFILSRIAKQKVIEHFNKLKKHTQQSLLKQNKWLKTLCRRINTLSTNKTVDLSRYAFYQIVKGLTVSKPQKNSKSIEIVSKATFATLSGAIIRIWKNNMLAFFQKTKSRQQEKYGFHSIVKILCNLANRKQSQALTILRQLSFKFVQVKSRVIQNALIVLKNNKKRLMTLAWRKLIIFSRQNNKILLQQSKQSPNRQSRKSNLASQNTPQKSKLNQKPILNQESPSQSYKIKIQNIKNELSSQKQEAVQKLQILKNSCEQLMQQNQYKKRVSQQLKQRADQIQYQQQDYIQPSDVLLETKLPLLYEIYMKVQKSTGEEVKTNSLLTAYPELEDDMQKSQLVNSWIAINNNLQLRKQVSVYEGQVQYERKAAKIAQDQQNMLVQMVKGYIREKYTWELVKNTLSHVSSQG